MSKKFTIHHYSIYLLVMDIYHVNKFTKHKPYVVKLGVVKDYDFVFHYQPIQWTRLLIEDHLMVWIDELPLYDPSTDSYTVPRGKPNMNIALLEKRRLHKVNYQKSKKGQLSLIS